MKKCDGHRPTLQILGLALVALGALTGCGGGEKAELVVYSAGPRPLAEFACRSFTEATGVPVELFSATTGQVLAKLEAEKFRPRADVVLFASQTAAEGLKVGGRLLAHELNGLGELRPGWSDPEGFYHGTAASCVGVATSSERPLPDETWRELLENRAGKRVVMPSPSRSGTAGDFLLAYYQRNGSTFWEDFLDARRSGLEIVGANSQAITGLLIGAYDVVFAAADYIICREIENGEPLAVQYPRPGAPFVVRPIAILASTKKAEEAGRFVDHYFSEEVQVAVAGLHLIPALRSVPLSAVREQFGIPDELPFDSGQALADQKTLFREFQSTVERAVVQP